MGRVVPTVLGVALLTCAVVGQAFGLDRLGITAASGIITDCFPPTTPMPPIASLIRKGMTKEQVERLLWKGTGTCYGGNLTGGLIDECWFYAEYSLTVVYSNGYRSFADSKDDPKPSDGEGDELLLDNVQFYPPLHDPLALHKLLSGSRE